jgi:RNA polymerase-binding transcription factor DksA
MTREIIEELAASLHEVYMKESTRQGDVRHAEDYNDLPENIKEFDRALARFILSRERLLLEKIGKPLRRIKEQNMPDSLWKTIIELMPTLQAIDEALAIIEKESAP